MLRTQGLIWAAAVALSPQACLAVGGPASDALAMPREFRAAWVATVANIDWPSRPGLPSDQQQTELIAILDRCVELNLNAVILQVRPSADALYDSPLEPWSEYLAGAMGRPPEPLYDPLTFAVEQAHRRGLELHAWFNPYRVRHADAKSPASPTHASVATPELVRTYGKYAWFDPGEPAAVEHFLAVVTDVVQRYDVDGVHIDDYFYPYPINDADGELVPFPDADSYARAQAAGDALSRDDWRRQNVDRLIERMYAAVKQTRPEVKVGISPFGIWRPGHPEGIAGFDQYASLYADARKWLREGWVDYFTPQLYWQIESRGQSYPKLLAWWASENVHQRMLWPGNYTSRVRTDASTEVDRAHWPASEVIQQITTTRDQPGATGNVHFSMKALMENRDGLADSLRGGVYRQPALVPACEWLPGEPPAPPTVVMRSRTAATVTVALTPGSDEAPWLWAVRAAYADGVQYQVIPGGQSAAVLDFRSAAGEPLEFVAATAVGRTGRESPLIRVPIGESPPRD